MAELTEGGEWGLSGRRVAEVLGVGEATVRRDKETAPNGALDAAEQIGPATDAAPNGARSPHVARATGENEWYTPKEYIEAGPTPYRVFGWRTGSISVLRLVLRGFIPHGRAH